MPAVEHQTVTIRGALRAHRVFTPDGWGKGELDVEGDPFPLIVIGKLLNVRVGDTVEVIGERTTHPEYGPQFKVHSCTPVQPASTLGVELWMASRLPHVGAPRARALVAHFGLERLWKTIETDPQALCVVPGITEKSAAEIAAAYASVSHERVHMSTLRGWGLTDGMVARCITTWGKLSEVVDHARANPYELADVVDGFGFLKADKIARAMGIAIDAPGRIRAAILFTLETSATRDGHCFMWGARLRDVAAEMLGIPTSLIVTQILAVCELKRVVRRGARLYSVKLDKAEGNCARAIARLLERN